MSYFNSLFDTYQVMCLLVTNLQRALLKKAEYSSSWEAFRFENAVVAKPDFDVFKRLTLR